MHSISPHKPPWPNSQGSADEDQASWLIEHLRVVGEVDSPGSWPPRAIG